MRPYILLLLIFSVACQKSETYDLVLKNGLVYDGNGGIPFLADIGINADTIAKIDPGLSLEATSTIDLEGMATAPGFINMLSWANVALLEDGRSQSDIRQGVTLEVMGEGRSMGPLTEEMKKEMIENQGDIKYAVEWTSLGEYLAHLEALGISTNVASFVGNGTLRRHVIGYENRPATAEEIEQMGALAASAMREGAVGISSALLYAPSRYANTAELTALAKVVADYDGMYVSHIRDEGDYLLESLDELLQIASEADIRSEVYHLKASAKRNWAKLDSAIAKIDSARTAGLPVTADM